MQKISAKSECLPCCCIAAVRRAALIVWSICPSILNCLLYTSDAADELDGVDLGGRRIIKKKFFQAEDGIRDQPRSRGLGDVYKRQSALLVDLYQCRKS